MVAFSDILTAQNRLRPYLTPTPLEPAPALGDGVYLKLENLNKLRSFKVRGSLNAMLSLSEAERSRGVVACSAGNHAQGVAHAAHLTGVQATVVMPHYAAQVKIEGVRHYGATIIQHEAGYDEAELYARQLERETGMVYISPYNDPRTIAGQGTIGLELFAQLPTVARVIVPVGGGGLASGIGLVCKTLNPACEVIGVQSVNTAAMHNILHGTDYPLEDSLADGLAGGIEDESITLEFCREVLNQLILVQESQIAEAIVWAIRQHNLIIEGSAAVVIAAMLTGQIPADGRPTALIVSGGNIDFSQLQRIICDTGSL